MAHASASGESGVKYASKTSAIASAISLFIWRLGRSVVSRKIERRSAGTFLCRMRGNAQSLQSAVVLPLLISQYLNEALCSEDKTDDVNKSILPHRGLASNWSHNVFRSPLAFQPRFLASRKDQQILDNLVQF
jgi:hypothetical protein